MGIGSRKTSGHIRTEFKHRTAYSNIKSHRAALGYKNLNYKAENYSNQKTIIGLDRDINHGAILSALASKLNLIAAGLILIFLSILVFMIFELKKIEYSPRTFPKSDNNSNQYEHEKEYLNTAYNVLNKSGARLLYANEFDLAQAEFSRALKVFPNGKIARRGLTKILIYKCQTRNQYCDEAQKNEAFLLQKGFASKSEIDCWHDLSLESLMNEIEDH